MEIKKMKLRNVLLILLTVLIVVKVASADQESDLIGLGMPAPLATKVANPEDLDVTNNVTIGGTLGVTGVSTFTGEADFNGGIDGGFTDGSILFSDSNGEISEDSVALSFNSSSNILYSEYIRSKATESVSAAGSTIADATDLTCSVCRVSTVNSGEGVQLPDVANGTKFVIQNAGANDLKLYPHAASGAAINAAGAGAAITLAAATDQIATCYRAGSTYWVCNVGAGPAA